jgi:hypothetical protein
MQVDSGGHKAGCFFCQFCDIENLANFSQKTSRVSQIYTRKKKIFQDFPNLFLVRATKFVGKEKNW